jgi:lipopolysaccharide heptosyltransferase I
MTKSVRSLLIVRLSAIGDVVHTLPALELLRAALPRRKIGWAVEAEAAPLLEGHPALDAVHVIDRRALGRARGRTRALRSCLSLLRGIERYDAAIDFQGLARSALVARLLARRVFGSKHARELAPLSYSEAFPVPSPADAHAVERYLALARAVLSSLGVSVGEAPAPRLALEESTLDLPEEFLALLPGAGKPANRPPVGFLAEVMRRSHLPTVVVGGAQDRPAGAALARAGALDLTGRLSLRESASVLARASVVLGGDTGPLHIARALRRPVVALFFAADPARTGPHGFPGDAPALVVRGGAPCAPCLARRCRRDDRVRICLEPLSVSKVLEAVEVASRRARVAEAVL